MNKGSRRSGKKRIDSTNIHWGLEKYQLGQRHFKINKFGPLRQFNPYPCYPPLLSFPFLSQTSLSLSLQANPSYDSPFHCLFLLLGNNNGVLSGNGSGGFVVGFWGFFYIIFIYFFFFLYLGFMANGGGEFQSGVDLRWSGCGFRCGGLVCYGFFRFGFCCYGFGWVLWPVVVGSNLGWICSGGGGGFVMDFFGSGFC